MAEKRIGFMVRDRIAPTDDPFWGYVTRSGKLEFWGHVATVAAREWDAMIARGVGRTGRKLAPIKPSTRKSRENPNYSPMGRADPDAPPLIPCYAASRTRSLLRSEVTADGVWFSWEDDEHTGENWGTILGYHRDGKVRGAARRDVIGLSRAVERRVIASAREWWTKNRGRLAARKFSRSLGSPQTAPERPEPTRTAKPPTPASKPVLSSPGASAVKPGMTPAEVQKLIRNTSRLSRQRGATSGPRSTPVEVYRVAVPSVKRR